MIEEAIEEVIEGTTGTVKNEDLNVEEATLEEKEEMIVTEVSSFALLQPKTIRGVANKLIGYHMWQTYN